MSDVTRSLSRLLGDLDDLVEADPSQVTALVLLWSRDEPGRVGEVAMVPGGVPNATAVLGRESASREGPAPVVFCRQRPGSTRRTGPLKSDRISRRQIELNTDGRGTLTLRSVGRGQMLVDGVPMESAVARVGQIVEIEQRALLQCAHRPPVLPEPPLGVELPRFHFGEADPWGMVGESPAMWTLRGRLLFVAGRKEHVLVQGPSGAGKERVAHAVHTSSSRARRTYLPRNAATLPEGLVDAELFGNARNYPNPGMAERTGLVGEADGGTLFLDEFAELPVEAQAHLLRVLDSGEYTRLGEARPRVADIRLIAATNRPVETLKHDVLARMVHRITVPGLDERLEDVPLIAHHLLRGIAAEDETVAWRFFSEGSLAGTPRTTPALITALTRRAWHTNVRELLRLLWEAISNARGDTLDLWPAFPAEGPERAVEAPPQPEPEAAPEPEYVDPATLAPERIQEVLDRHDGAQEPAWRELGLSSRHVLTRLVKRYKLRVKGRSRP